MGLGRSFAEKDLWESWWEVTMSQQHALAAKKPDRILDCGRGARTSMFPLYSVLVGSHLNITCRFGLLIARRALIRWRELSGRSASWSGAPALIL